MTYPRISVLICTRDRCAVLKKCLDSVAALEYPKELLEIAVLDDNSSDHTPEVIPEYLIFLKTHGFKNTHFSRNERNLNIAHSRYILGQKVSPDIEAILFVDDDACLDPGCLKTLSRYMVEHPDVGIVGPRIVYADNPGKTAHGANFIGRWTARYREEDATEPTDCDWVNSTCCLVKKEVLDKTGGFYPGFYTAHEEADFCLRAKKEGFKVVYCPQAVARHELDRQVSKRERLYYLYRNKLLLIHRNFPFFHKCAAFFLVLIFGLPKYLFESVRFNKKISFDETGTILISLWHGFLGISGPRRGG